MGFVFPYVRKGIFGTTPDDKDKPFTFLYESARIPIGPLVTRPLEDWIRPACAKGFPVTIWREFYKIVTLFPSVLVVDWGYSQA